MHELSLIQSLLDIAVEHARRHEARKIHRIEMRVGALSGAVPQALTFAFDALVRGTMAEGARLEIEEVPIVCHCAPCDLEFESPDLFCECPRCGRPGAEVRRGRELELTSLEVS